ncbi:DUF4870 family protein [Facilibium subflavum]|uniref:DUF4870 family protein n=1 Tax=Facilibium subflavum TaxID=2219058 RepID=UPI000E65AE56|nr:hypothetical protein [Facilibium subflavum]
MKNETYARAVYILYFIGFFTGLTAIIGVILAHIKKNEPDVPFWLKSHFSFQIKTFWYGIIYLIIATLLLAIGIGIVVYIWWFIWTLIHSIKGFIALDNQSTVTGKDGFWGLGEFNLSKLPEENITP